jgi:hypothetical protein
VTAVMIGVDPHKLSNTIVVIDGHEKILARHRFANDREGYRALRRLLVPIESGPGRSRAPRVSG